MYYALTGTSVTAMKITAENLDQVATWCGGSVKGIKLPADLREIEFRHRGEEGRARVGEWLVCFHGNFGKKYFVCITDVMFSDIFAET